MSQNPLLQEWNTPYQSPPFHDIKTEHYKPAVLEALAFARKEVEAISDNPEEAGFENTIVALENTGEQLDRITSVFFNLNHAETSEEMQKLAQEISPELTRFSNDISMDAQLFERVKSVWDQRDALQLSSEQYQLLERKYKFFVKGGALLSGEEKKRYREISEELSKLSLQHNENVLAETNGFALHITDEQELAGLPDAVREAAAGEARKRNKEGWVFTLHHPAYVPFMQYAHSRKRREELYRAFASRAFRGNKNDNREIVKKMVNLRRERAALLGYSSHAEMVLEDRMAEKPEKVMHFLEELYSASHPHAEKDFREISDFAKKVGFRSAVERWDWAFFSEQLKKLRYDMDEETLRPWFELGKVRNAIFDLAGRLYEIRFRRNTDIQTYHEEVEAWEVLDADGSFLSILYLDFHPREGKSQGAWMTTFREQSKKNGRDIRPFVSLVCNFRRSTESMPSLLSFSEVTTFLHEFGHGLHGMLTRTTWESLSGTNVARDFVELPSQVMENWAYEKEWLDTFATHYKTGEKIPKEYIEKLREAGRFQAGYACDRQLGFGFLDMAWHSLEQPFEGDIDAFEKQILARIDLFPPIEGTNISSAFGHLFAGGYAAGYYGYKWAEVLDADTFSLFKEKGIFDRETARRFREEILEKGGTEKPMELYRNFRGKEPDIQALLERDGLDKPAD